jgi:hypothetical protein
MQFATGDAAMRKLLLVGTAVLGMAGAPAALAQDSATQSASASVRLVQPVTLTKASDLAFGTVVKPSRASNTVTMSNDSDTPALTGPGDGSLAASSTSRAAFTVGGEGGSTFSISVPAAVTMTRTDGPQTIAVTLAASSTSGTLSGSIGSTGSASFTVGGAFTASAGTASGSYAGAFDTVVAYN